MRELLQICSYIFFSLSRRTKNRNRCFPNEVRTDLQQLSHRGSYAVLSVEAAIVLPLFLFVVLCFCYLFQVLEFQLKLQSALNQTAEQTASYGYLLGRITAVTEQKAEDMLERTGLFSEEGLISVDDAGAWVVSLLGSAPAESALKQLTAQNMDIADNRMLRVVNGWNGVSFEGSSLRDETRCVVVVAEYRIRVPFVPEIFGEIEMRQSATCRLHCGDRDYIPKQKDVDEAEEEKEYYVTPNGTVYHLTRECRYLKISVLSTDKDKLGVMRNSSGGKYHPCLLCVHGAELSDKIYYTSGGSSYHSSKNCSSLTRTVIVKSEEGIAGLPPCSNCGR